MANGGMQFVWNALLPTTVSLAFGAEIIVGTSWHGTTPIAEGVLCTHIVVLILDTEEHIDQRSFVDHVVEATEERAKQTPDPFIRQQLNEIAHKWRQMAEHETKHPR